MNSRPDPKSTSAVKPALRRHSAVVAATISASDAPGFVAALIASHIFSPMPAACRMSASSSALCAAVSMKYSRYTGLNSAFGKASRTALHMP
ncbi:hypothetical protein D3C72_2111250 [compost metagenome]